MTIRRPWRCSLLSGLLATAPLASAAAQASAPRLEDTSDVGSFIDGVAAAHLARHTAAAAVVVLIKGDQVLLARGYGHANLERGAPVNPATSMFHIGSTGKLFTWTAVMQLVEQGKLDLDRDVNTYLKTFQIPATFPEPITLRHLLTHTAGFEEGVLGYFISLDSTHISSLEETVRRHLPARVRPPGVLSSYSNYGAALAGYIVQQVSGEPYAQYIERHIYEPLGIRYATFREPIPAPLAPYAVTGYRRENGAWVPQPYEIDGGFSPAGGTSISALDMARFMMAHLQDGRYGDRRILEPATAELMHRRAFAADPRLPGMALGFIEKNVNGRRTIEHSGDSFWFHTGLTLFPEEQVGLFVSVDGDPQFVSDVERAVFDRYFPAPVPTAAPAPGKSEPLSPGYAGTYRLTRRNHTKVDKVVGLLAPTTRVAVLPNGRLLVIGGPEGTGDAIQYAPIGPHLFREVQGYREISFGQERGGRFTYLYSDPTAPVERTPWYEDSAFWYPALTIAMLILLSALLTAWYRRETIRSMPPFERRAMRLSTVTALWLLLTLVALALVIGTYQTELMGRIPLALKAALILPLGFVALSVWLLITAARIVRRSAWPLGTRVHFLLVALAAAVFSWFFAQWNLLGWRFG